MLVLLLTVVSSFITGFLLQFLFNLLLLLSEVLEVKEEGHGGHFRC